ncbi:MAG: metal-dependent hydrolase, partial [Romboutsia sp.]|nr:metal-dependent hydrolase [Romboutsia sp.]
DKERTYISNRLPFVSKFINKTFGHRTITHSLTLFFFLLFLFSYLELNIFISSGFLIGYLSHIILDMFNKKGVQLFYPFKIKVRLMKIATGTISENFFKYLLIATAFTLIVYK